MHACICICTFASSGLVYDVLLLKWLMIRLGRGVFFGSWSGFLLQVRSREPCWNVKAKVSLNTSRPFISHFNDAKQTTTSIHAVIYHSGGSDSAISIPNNFLSIFTWYDFRRHGFSSQRLVGIGFSCLTRGRASERASRWLLMHDMKGVNRSFLRLFPVISYFFILFWHLFSLFPPSFLHPYPITSYWYFLDPVSLTMNEVMSKMT